MGKLIGGLLASVLLFTGTAVAATPSNPDDCNIRSSALDPFPIGFPRPDRSLLGEQNISIFAIPYQYSDIPFTEQDYENSVNNLEQVKKFIEVNSYGKAKVNYKLADISNLVKLSGKSDNLNYSNQFFAENANFQAVDGLIEQIINEYKGPEALSNFTVIAIFSPTFPAYGLGFNGRPEGYETNKGLIKRTILQFGEIAASPLLTIHEMQHALFSLPDLYNHAAATVGKPKYVATAGWGVMSNLSNYGKNDFAWEKYLNGWLTTNQVKCLNSKSKAKITLTLQAENTPGTKLALVRISQTKVVAIEYRAPGISYDGMNIKNGALVYLVDGKLSSGKDPVKVLIKPDITTLKNRQTLKIDNIKITQLSNSDGQLVLQLN